jgi:hypothetical protein
VIRAGASLTSPDVAWTSLEVQAIREEYLPLEQELPSAERPISRRLPTADTRSATLLASDRGARPVTSGVTDPHRGETRGLSACPGTTEVCRPVRTWRFSGDGTRRRMNSAAGSANPRSSKLPQAGLTINRPIGSGTGILGVTPVTHRDGRPRWLVRSQPRSIREAHTRG